MTLTDQHLHDALAHALECVLCFCGNFKRINKPFCFQCFDRLPTKAQRILKRNLTLAAPANSYPLAHCYDAAHEWLISHGVTTHSAPRQDQDT